MMEQISRTLLLLPCAPYPLSSAAIKAAFGAPIDGTLKRIKQTKDHHLDVAISVPTLWLLSSPDASRIALFETAQKVLALTYSLIGVTAASHSIELDGLDGLNVHVFYLVQQQDPSDGQTSGRDHDEDFFSGPFVALSILIDSRPTYETLFTVDTEDGDRLQKAFFSRCQSNHRLTPTSSRVPRGDSTTDSSDRFPHPGGPPDRAHVSVAVGGTFDHLHIGHKLLLTSTALLAEPKGSRKNPSQTVFLTIGISGDDMLTNKTYAEEMESWDERQTKASHFLESILVFSPPRRPSSTIERVHRPGPNGKRVRVTYGSDLVIDYVEISDPFGPTITDQNISALVLSQETRSGGKVVNEKRQEKGWPPLEVFEVDVLEFNRGPSDATTASFDAKISSTQTRRRLHEKAHSTH